MYPKRVWLGVRDGRLTGFEITHDPNGETRAHMLKKYKTTLVEYVPAKKEGTVTQELSAELIIPMLLDCPRCQTQHIDEGEWETRPHKTHECQKCGLQWRPANVATVGVMFLSGKKPQHDLFSTFGESRLLVALEKLIYATRRSMVAAAVTDALEEFDAAGGNVFGKEEKEHA